MIGLTSCVSRNRLKRPKKSDKVHQTVCKIVRFKTGWIHSARRSARGLWRRSNPPVTDQRKKTSSLCFVNPSFWDGEDITQYSVNPTSSFHAQRWPYSLMVVSGMVTLESAGCHNPTANTGWKKSTVILRVTGLLPAPLKIKVGKLSEFGKI